MYLVQHSFSYRITHVQSSLLRTLHPFQTEYQIPVGKGQVVHLHSAFHSYQREVPWRCADPEGVYGGLLDKTRRKNTGEIPQYYVDEHHEPIIPPDLFDFVQSEIKARENGGKHSGVSIFANKIKCGCCGGWYGARVWHSTDKYRRVIYRCNKKYAHEGKPCSTRHLTEEEIKQIFVKALNSLVGVKENVIEELRSLIDSVCQTGELVEEHGKIEQELSVLAERLETLIRENARVAQDQTAYLKQENEIRARYLEKQGALDKLDEQITERESKRNTLEGMIQVVCGINGEQVAFDEELWSGLLEHIVVKEGGAAVVVFKGGIEICVGG